MKSVYAIWLRNLLYFRKSLLISFFWSAYEPILYLLAIGFSLGRAVGQVEGVSYAEFYLPGLLASTAMMVSYFESSYGGFTKLQYQKTYSTILLAPISTAELVIGEILWSATKGLFGILCVIVVAGFFGMVNTWSLIPTFFVLGLVSLMFSTFGILVMTFVKNYESFTYTTSGLIIPMSLFSGTYFPLTELPVWAQNLAQLLPLTPAVQVVRGLMLETEQLAIIWPLLFMSGLTLASGYWAIRRLEAKLRG